MKALILLCSFLITLSQYAFAQQDLVYGGDIRDIEITIGHLTKTESNCWHPWQAAAFNW